LAFLQKCLNMNIDQRNFQIDTFFLYHKKSLCQDLGYFSGRLLNYSSLKKDLQEKINNIFG
ncbi:MAG: hypothetical protein WCS73_11150, partial [Lentisphaeria bacterium]